MSMMFQKATKKSARLRMALIGVAGSGKTYTALSIASHLGKKVAVMDTELGSASKYSDIFDFDVMEPETFNPKTYIDAIQAAEEAGYDVLILDSLSHAWAGKEGALEQVDKVARRTQSGSNFGAWRDVTPLHNAMVDAIIGSRLHIIATMRAKTEYVQEKNEKTGKTSVRKVGMAPVQRDGLEYEFDVVADLDQDNNLIVGKTRCPGIAGMVVNRAGREIAAKLNGWLSDGGERTVTKAAPVLKKPVEKVRQEVEKPAQETLVPPVAEADYEEIETMHCDCGVAAKYVRGKSGNGWVCGNFGSGKQSCDFRMKDDAADLSHDPFEDAEVSLNGAHG